MPNISTQHLEALPDVAQLRALLQSLATLDATLSPEWVYRYYSFNAHWSPNDEMGSMRDGSGDEFFALFNSAGCFIKGFAHDSLMSPYRSQPPTLWPGILDGIPEDFSSAVNEPAFSMHDVTFFIWRRYTDAAWSIGPIDFPAGADPDGSEEILSILDNNPRAYCTFAANYFEVTIPLDVVQQIYEHVPLTESMVSSLNAETSLKELEEDLVEIGYPR